MPKGKPDKEKESLMERVSIKKEINLGNKADILGESNSNYL